MIVYLDLMIMCNFIIEFLFLYILEKLYEDEIKYLRIFIGALIGSFSLVLLFCNYILYTIFKIIGGILIGLIAFNSISKSKQIIKISSFYALNFAFVGFLKSFNVNDWLLLFVGIIVILGLFILESNKKYFIFLKRCTYNVIIDTGGKSLKLKAFLDTGNECFCDDIPVVFIDRKYKDNSLKPVNHLLLNTAAGSNLSMCYKAEKFYIVIGKKKLKKNVYIVFSDINRECLLNPNILL